MKRTLMIAIAGIALSHTSFALAQSPPPSESDPASARSPTRSESIARQPNPQTEPNTDRTNPPVGAKGPMEGVGTPMSPDQSPRVISPKEGPGVQNPGMGTGLNGSSSSE